MQIIKSVLHLYFLNMLFGELNTLIYRSELGCSIRQITYLENKGVIRFL